MSNEKKSSVRIQVYLDPVKDSDIISFIDEYATNKSMAFKSAVRLFMMNLGIPVNEDPIVAEDVEPDDASHKEAP